MYTLDQVIIMVSDKTGLYPWVYGVGNACLIVCQVMNAPTFVATVLAVLSLGVEVPEGDGSMPESLSGPGDAAYPIHS
jgi:hypothetical protein